MSSPMRLGAMVTLWDRFPIALPELGFLELLVLPQDDMAEVKGFCDRFDGELVVHAPGELPDGRPLDLASPDKGWREASVRRVREVTKAAEGTARPVVIHPGGVTEAPVQEAGPLLGALRSSLEDLPDYTWLENMPLHHHHRGRRLHCNLMRTPGEMAEVEGLVAGFTVDVAHAYLGVEGDGNANVRAMFVELGEAVRHVHLSDARRPDEKGLMPGDGEVDMSFLPYLRGLPVLLEVGTGRLADGAALREALRRMRS